MHFSTWNFCGIVYTVRAAFHAISNSLPAQQLRPLDNIDKDVWQKIIYYDVWIDKDIYMSDDACAEGKHCTGRVDGDWLKLTLFAHSASAMSAYNTGQGRYCVHKDI